MVGKYSKECWGLRKILKHTLRNIRNRNDVNLKSAVIRRLKPSSAEAEVADIPAVFACLRFSPGKWQPQPASSYVDTDRIGKAEGGVGRPS